MIPNGTAGLLIGKGGTIIKQIKDETGAFIQISSKQIDHPERVVCIEGEKENRSKALALIVKKISEDPQHNNMTNLSYGLASSHATVDPYLVSNGPQGSVQIQTANSQSKFDFNSAANYLGLFF